MKYHACGWFTEQECNGLLFLSHVLHNEVDNIILNTTYFPFYRITTKENPTNKTVSLCIVQEKSSQQIPFHGHSFD